MTDQSSPQQPEEHPALGPMGTSADPAFKEALRERAEHFAHTEPTWKPRATPREETPVPPADRLAHLGRVEHPVETWPMLKMMPPAPNPRADLAAEFEPWAEQFIAGAQDGEDGR